MPGPRSDPPGPLAHEDRALPVGATRLEKQSTRRGPRAAPRNAWLGRRTPRKAARARESSGRSARGTPFAPGNARLHTDSVAPRGQHRYPGRGRCPRPLLLLLANARPLEPAWRESLSEKHGSTLLRLDNCVNLWKDSSSRLELKKSKRLHPRHRKPVCKRHSLGRCPRLPPDPRGPEEPAAMMMRMRALRTVQPAAGNHTWPSNT